ncbi:MAG: Histidine kinase [Ferruginibacter sp.]|nr:Histidine kinase [Ferruginibacter sp.]
MKLRLPQYTGKDYLVMLVIVPAFSLFINYNIFGRSYFSNGRLFLLASLITGVGFCIDFIVCGWIAVAMKNRFPAERQLMKRLTLMILVFLLLTGLFLYSLFQLYEYFLFYSYEINEVGFIWNYISLGIINVFLTFLMEGISRYQSWKAKWEETEQLKKSFAERRLQGLRRQVNQHFLFESLDSLSSLIRQEDDEAEFFLDEMSKVYRYMLQMDDEPLVTLDTEVKFIESYRHLLQARYGEALRMELNIAGCDRSKLLPPLSLQLILENILSLNHISNANPLTISICSEGKDAIQIINNLQPKNMEAVDDEVSLDNLSNNYRVLINCPMMIDESGTHRTIHLPLLTKKIKEEEIV